MYSRTISRIKSGFKHSKYFLPNGKPYEEILNENEDMLLKFHQRHTRRFLKCCSAAVSNNCTI